MTSMHTLVKNPVNPPMMNNGNTDMNSTTTDSNQEEPNLKTKASKMRRQILDNQKLILQELKAIRDAQEKNTATIEDLLAINKDCQTRLHVAEIRIRGLQEWRRDLTIEQLSVRQAGSISSFSTINWREE